MNDLILSHYRRLADHYDDFLSYSPSFVPTVAAKMVRMLRLREDDRLVDLGCGSGLYSLEILRQKQLRHPVVGVDPSGEMLARIPERAPIERVRSGALGFSERPARYDKVLIKEAVHHVDRRDRLFENLHRNLSDGGIVLLVHVPPKVTYPLFRKALDRCAVWHADPADLEQRLRRAGFDVERDTLVYRHAIPKHRFFTMVAARYMSVLSSFEEHEIAEGLVEMEETHAERDVLEFDDRFDCIAGLKNASH